MFTHCPFSGSLFYDLPIIKKYFLNHLKTEYNESN